MPSEDYENGIMQLLPDGAISRGTLHLVQFDPQEEDEPWAVYEKQAGVATLLGEGRTSSEALAGAAMSMESENGPRGGEP